MYFVNHMAYKHPNNVGISSRSYRMNEYIWMHCHNFYEFEYIVSGHGTHTLNNKQYELQPGDFWGLGLEDFHRFDNCDVEMRNLIIILPYASEEFRKLLERTVFPIHGNIPPEKRETVEHLFSTIEHLFHSDSPYREPRMTAYALALITEYLEYGISGQSSIRDMKTYRYVQKALLFISEHYREPITLQNAAEAANVSPVYLSSVFPTYAGCSFTESLNRTRLTEACLLLQESSIPVLEIASRTGFGSVSTMNRVFQKYLEISPSEYRKINKNVRQI